MSESKTDLPSGPNGPGQDTQKSSAAPVVDALEPRSPGLGKRLKIRSMVTMAGEVLPFFWPMRNFIHHNPLHGLEQLPFEQAVSEASRLFHARGYLTRTQYQRMLIEGSIDRDMLEALVSEFVAEWLAEQNGDDDRELSDLLRLGLMAMLTQMSHPAPGEDVPCAEDVLAALKRGTS
jgi:hypothetical protein